jgi:hypothetical protein
LFLIPYGKVTIYGTFSAKKARNRLSSEMSPVFSYLIQAKFSDRLFKGKIAHNEFEMMRVVRNRNTFLPFVKGKIEETQTGCEITLKMRPMLVSLFIIGLFFIVAGFISFNISFQAGKFDWTSLIPIAGMFLFYIFMFATFEEEVDFIKYHVAKFAGSDEFNDLQFD